LLQAKRTKTKIISSAFEDLKIALKKLFLKVKFLTNKSYDEEEFKIFIETLMMDIPDHAKNKK